MIRPVSFRHRKRIIEIASKIWEGDDYLETVVDEWLSDSSAEFVGLWENGVLAGFGRMKYIGPGDVWLEGLRKDPDLKVKGIGKRIAEYFLKRLKELPDLRSVRFSTYFDNKASIIINERLGFRKTVTLSLKTLDLTEKKPIAGRDTISAETDLFELKAYLDKSRFQKLTSGNEPRGLIYKGWVVYPRTDEHLMSFLKRGQVRMIREKDRIKGLLLFCDINYDNVLWISFLEASTPGDYLKLIEEAVSVAVRKGKTEIQLLVPDMADLKKACSKAGFESWEQENDFLLYELPLESLNLERLGQEDK